jgi:hypothetical protein
MNKLICIPLALSLAACVSDNNVRVTNERAVAAVQTQARSEPVYYNGKTYQFGLDPDGAGGFGLSVTGMTAGQQKDAVAVATSAMRYFACPDGQNGRLDNTPHFENGRWQMHAKCG